MVIPAIFYQILFASFCLVTFIQVVYYLYFFAKLAFYKQPIATTTITQPVSVIICAKNEAPNLYTNLPAVLIQNYKTTHEIIVVNDNSEDESRYIIDELKKDFKNLSSIELVQEAKLIPGKKFPLSMGIKSSKYETLLLTDADCKPATNNWVNHMQNGYGEGIEIVLGYGKYTVVPGLLNKLIRFETFHTALQYLSFALAGKTYMGVGRNLSYKKELFIKNKGFSSINHVASGDDDLFINKVATQKNTAIVIDHEAHTLSVPKTTFNSWIKQKNRHYTTAKYYKASHKFLLGLYSASFFMFYPLFIASMLFYNWWMALIVFGVRFILQAIVYIKSMKKLNEKDLAPWFWLLDIWMFFYQIIFIPSLWKKPKQNW
jgi:glycosyltransferase involved in cell wall biosynthesis